MTDDDLMIRIQSGDEQAFATLVDRYQGILIGFFMKNTRDLQLSEDLAQETLLKVHSQAWDYLPTGRFRGWIFRIARNHLIDNVRRRSNDALVRSLHHHANNDDDPLARLAAELRPPEQEMEQQEFVRLVDELLEEIPDDQRQTFLLHHYSDLSLAEVAEITDVPMATSKSRLRLAREKLAEKLRSRGVNPPEELPLESS
ncbi:MAG TPA: sigma-70 family RNA polymerase sigma factor [Planctomicrobium sp.]|nr:sigma-70 family RNA polymerase sigma factor [Planctomicrobium sp.]